MKSKKLIYKIVILFMFGISVVKADFIVSKNDSAYKDYFGIVNALYIQESRLVISDVSVFYTHSSRFNNRSGSNINNLDQGLKPGTPVRFRIYKNPPKLILNELTVISQSEFNNSKRRNRGQ